MIPTRFAKAGKSGMATTFSRIAVRRDTAENWHDPLFAKLPLEGEICLTVKGDGGTEDLKYSHEWGQIKIGDGVSDWADLEYYGGGDAEVIVDSADPAPGWPGGGTVPEGVLWFNTGTETLLIRVGDDWVKISPDNELYFADSSKSPVNPNHGDLWHISDIGLLKVYDENAGVEGGDWVPACAPPNAKDDPSNMVMRTGDSMTGALDIADTSKGEDELVFNVKTTAGGNGGFSVTNNGKVYVEGNSESIQEVNQVATKAYVDNTVTASGGDYVKLQLPYGEQQYLKNAFNIDEHPDTTQHSPDVLRDIKFDEDEAEAEAEATDLSTRQTSDNYGVRSRFTNYQTHVPKIILGNKGEVFRDGEDLPVSSIWANGWNIYVSHNSQRNMIPKVESKFNQRITLHETFGIDCDDNHPNPAYRGKNKTNTEGFDVDRISTRNVYWSKSNIKDYDYEDGHPIQKFGWVADPDSSVYKNDSLGEWGPPELRPATKGYVDRKLQDEGLSKGSDLCADSEADASVGGFWRDSASGTIYLKVS